MFLIFSLSVMLFLTIFSVIFGNSFIGGYDSTIINSEHIVDGVSSTYYIDTTDSLFQVDSITGAIVVIATLITLATILGVNFLGSGLSDESVRVIIIFTGYAGLWTVLSVLAFNLVIGIQLFGILIYITLTIFYVIGVVQKITSG